MPCGMYGMDKESKRDKMDDEPLTEALGDHKRGSREATDLAGLGEMDEEPDNDRSVPPLF